MIFYDTKDKGYLIKLRKSERGLRMKGREGSRRMLSSRVGTFLRCRGGSIRLALGTRGFCRSILRRGGRGFGGDRFLTGLKRTVWKW